MAHPRASFPDQLVIDYSLFSLKSLAVMYKSNHCTIRRWLTDRGVAIKGKADRRNISKESQR